MKTQPIAYGNIYWHISSLGISVLLVHISFMTFKSMLHDNRFTNYLSHSCTEYIEINILQCQIHQYIKKRTITSHLSSLNMEEIPRHMVLEIHVLDWDNN